MRPDTITCNILYFIIEIPYDLKVTCFLSTLQKLLQEM